MKKQTPLIARKKICLIVVMLILKKYQNWKIRAQARMKKKIKKKANGKLLVWQRVDKQVWEESAWLIRGAGAEAVSRRGG